MKLVGKMIKWHRNKNGYTQEQLADGICSVTQLSKIENNQIPANEEILLSISQKLNINEEKLINKINPSCIQLIEEWLNSIHEYDLPKMKVYYEKIMDCKLDNAHYDVEFLFDLALFGYYLITVQLKEADKAYLKIYEYEELFEEIDPYSYHKFLGEYLKNKGLFTDALRHLKKAEDILQEVEDPELFMLLAVVNSHLENLLVSNNYAHRALRIFQAKLYYMRIIECEIIISANHTFVQEYGEAEKNLQRLELLIDDKFEHQSIVKIYFHKGLVHVLKRELDEAEKYLKKCLEYSINESEVMHARYLIAHMYYLKQDYDLVKKYIEEGASIAEEYKLEYYLIKFRALNFLVNHDDKGLVDYLRKRVIPFFRLTGQAFDLKYYYQLLGYTLYKLKRYKSASEILMVADGHRKQLMDYKFESKN